MKVKLKKWMFALIVLLAFGILAACSDDSEAEGEGEVEASGLAMEDYGVGDTFKAAEPITFSMLYSDHPNYPLEEDWPILKEIQERTNVELDMTVVPMSDYENKRSLLISSGDAPLIIPKTYPGQEAPFVSSGAILPISDYVDRMPHFKEKMEKWNIAPFLDNLRQEDGKYYVLPGMHENVWPDWTLGIRKDILDELGLEVPTTWEELEVVLEEMKKAYPEVTPYSDQFHLDSALNIAATGFGTMAGWGLSNALDYDAETDKFVFAGATDEYREMVTYFNGLVEKGLLDKESVTQEDKQAEQKFINGESFVMSMNAQTLEMYRKDMANTLGEGNFEIVKIPVPGGPAGELMAGSKLENGIMFSSAAKDDPNFDALLQFIDWLYYSDEGQEFTKWGIEGETYTKEDGKYKLTEDIDYRGLNPEGSKNLQVDYGFSGGVFAYGGKTELLHSMFTEEEIAWQNYMHENKEVVLPDPAIKYDAMELEKANLLGSPLRDHMVQNTLKFIIGERSLDEWDAYVKELEAKNMQGYVDQANEVYENSK